MKTLHDTATELEIGWMSVYRAELRGIDKLTLLLNTPELSDYPPELKIKALCEVMVEESERRHIEAAAAEFGIPENEIPWQHDYQSTLERIFSHVG